MAARTPCHPSFPPPALVMLVGVFVLLGLAPFAAPPCAADTCWNWNIQFPHEVNADRVPYDGFPTKLAVHGSYVYAAHSSEIVVLDLGDPWFASEVDRWTLAGLVRDLAVIDDCLVVLRAEDPGTTAEKLEFYSLADPAHPLVASNVPFAATSYALAGAGGILYARNSSVIQLYDISDPFAPELLGDIPQGSYRLSADVGRLYFAVDNLVYLYDTSTPGSPSLLGWWTAPSNILDVDAHGDKVYVVYGQTFLVLDFQQPLVPQVVGELEQQPYDPRTLIDIMSVGDAVYLRRSLDWDTKDLLAVDASDLGALVPLWVAPLDLVYSIAAGSHFVVIGEQDFDYTDPRLTILSFDPSTERPSFVNPGPGATLTGFHKIAIVDDVAWWGGGYQLTGVDVASMPNTSEVGSIDFTGDLQALAGQDGLLYLGLDNTTWGLQVYDVSDPGAAEMVGHVAEDLDPLAMLIGDGVLYVADGNNGLVVFSLQDPQQPTFVQRLALPGTIADVALEGSLLCIAAGVEGLLVADCSDPENPTVVGRTLPGVSCYGVATDEGYAYLRYFELSVVDLAVPTSPTVVAQLPVNAGSSLLPEGGRILIHDGFLYLGSLSDGLQMLDVRNPAEPRPITDAWVATYVLSLAIHRDHVLLAGAPLVAGSTVTPYEGLMGFPVQCSETGGVGDHPLAPQSLHLSVFPNPLNPTATVTFSARRGVWSKVQVFDARGRLVDTLFDGIQTGQDQSIVWKAERQASGVYFLRLESEGKVVTGKMTLLK